MGIEAFKILYKTSPKYLHDLISLKNTNYSFRYENLADVPVVTERLRFALSPLSSGTVSQTISELLLSSVSL